MRVPQRIWLLLLMLHAAAEVECAKKNCAIHLHPPLPFLPSSVRSSFTFKRGTNEKYEKEKDICTCDITLKKIYWNA